MMDLRLRNVVPEDIDLLFRWANDPVTRQNSFNAAPIPYEDHRKWFQTILADENVFQYILCNDGQPVGQIRLRIEGDCAWISYSIDADKRGMGFGSRMLELVKAKVMEDRSDVRQLAGQVKPENIASASVFEKAGYSKTDKGSFVEYRLCIHGN